MCQRGAGVQDAEHHTLTFANANRFAVSQGVTVHRKVFVDDVESSVGVAACAEVAVPSVEGQENFCVILRGIILRLNVEKTELTGVRAAFQIASGRAVCVIPTRARRLRNERVSLRAVRRNKGSAFLHGAGHLRRNCKAVPVDKFGMLRLIFNLDRNVLTLAETEDWSGNRAVVADCFDYFPGSDFEFYG